MKTISTILLAVVLTAFSFSEDKPLAVPAKIQGIDVYVMSEPSRPYEIIKSGGSVSWFTCNEAINTPVNKAAKEPGAQGVIIYFPVSGKYSIIKYKE